MLTSSFGASDDNVTLDATPPKVNQICFKGRLINRTINMYPVHLPVIIRVLKSITVWYIFNVLLSVPASNSETLTLQNHLDVYIPLHGFYSLNATGSSLPMSYSVNDDVIYTYSEKFNSTKLI